MGSAILYAYTLIYYILYIISNLYCSMYINVYIYIIYGCHLQEHVCVHFRHHYYRNCFGFFPSSRRIISPHPIRAHLIAFDDTLTSLKTLVKKRFSLSKSQNVTSSLWEMTPTAHCVSIQQMVSLSTQLVKFCG